MTVMAQLLADNSYWDGHMVWGGWWMLVWGTLMMAGVVILAVWLVRSLTTTSAGPSTPTADPLDRARQILAERYARGELTSDQYRERLDLLS